MLVTPLVILAQAVIPSLTDLVSDTLPVSAMTVAANGLITLTAANHGIPVGQPTTVVVVRAGVPNAIASWTLNADGSITLGLSTPHSLSASIGGNSIPYHTTATIAGTAVTGLDGTVDLLSVVDAQTIIVMPSSEVTSLPVSIPAGAMQVDAGDCLGWNVATATNANTLTMPTPASVTRSYTAVAPKIAGNIRIMGAYSLDAAMTHYTRFNESIAPNKGKAWLFVVPEHHVQISRDRRSASDANADDNGATTRRQVILDGFTIYAAIPAELTTGGVAAMDKANGPLLTAILGAFNYRALPAPEYAMPGKFDCIIAGHGAENYNKATYVHRYHFQRPLMLTAFDSVPAEAIPDVTAIAVAIQNGGIVPTYPLPPPGSWPASEIIVDPVVDTEAPAGIYQQGLPSPLTAVVELDN